MLLLILGVSIALAVVGGIIATKSYDWDNFGVGLAVTSGILGCVTLIVIAILSINASTIYGIDQKIDMYEAQNAKIEESIAVVVEKYMQHENDIMTEVAPESALTLVSLYPELKSDTLIEKQIKVYVSNNEKITELKEERINAPLYRWWLYFGK